MHKQHYEFKLDEEVENVVEKQRVGVRSIALKLLSIFYFFSSDFNKSYLKTTGFESVFLSGSFWSYDYK